jgi:diguanylate cyclase (GGDEF)-like protein/PAS domain S-box-containing protein
MKQTEILNNILEKLPKGAGYFELIEDSDGRPIDAHIVGVNDLFTTYIGNNFITAGKNVSECVDLTEDIQWWLNVFSDVNRSKESKSIIYFAKETQLWFDVTLFTFSNCYLMVMLDDITEEKRLEKNNVKLKDEYEMIFNSTQDAMFLMAVDNEEKFIYKRLNKSHEESTGLTTKVVFNKTPVDLFGKKLGQDIHDKYMSCVEAKKPVSYEETLSLLSGTKVWFTTLSPIIKSGRVTGIVGASKDITQMKLAEMMLEYEKENIQTVMHSMNDAIISTNLDGIINFVNQAARELIKKEDLGILGYKFDDVFKIYDDQGPILLDDYRLKVINDVIESQRFDHLRLLLENGDEKKINYKRGILKNEDGLVLSISDETQKVKNEKALIYISMHDKLTGLYNRAYFDEALERLDSKRQLPLSIIIGDVNGLKITNDVFGHLEGDRLLILIADLMRETFRSEDIIARWGGDEFCVILPQTTYDQASEIINRIMNACELSEAQPIKPSISFGLATKTNEDENINDVFNKSEERMYSIKLHDSKKNKNFITKTLQNRLEEISIETVDHCNRMKVLIKKHQDYFDLSKKEKEQLMTLVDIHDIGNIIIPREILLKKQTLTEEERSEIRRHSEIGYRIALSSVALGHYSEMILSHHERWDGKGYPQGLKKDEIPKLSRILCLFDAYDAMTTYRTYKEKMDKAEAVEEIKKCAGSQFDPKYSEIFIKALLAERV